MIIIRNLLLAAQYTSNGTSVSLIHHPAFLWVHSVSSRLTHPFQHDNLPRQPLCRGTAHPT